MAVRATQNLGPHVHSESEQLFAGKLASKYVLRLYVAGRGVFSARAMGNIKRLCDTILRGRCELQIIDLYQQPTLAKRDHVVTVPTLVKLYPPPVVTLIGDMSN